MPIEVDGVQYLTQKEVEEEVGVTRQTLWRWRRDGKVPAGREFRDRQRVFSLEEVEQIRAYAYRMSPDGDRAADDQFSLF